MNHLGQIDSGQSSVMVHLGAPGTVAVHGFEGDNPFVSLEVAPDVTLMSQDPQALLLFERAVRDARLRMWALLETVDDAAVLSCEAFESEVSVQEVTEAFRAPVSHVDAVDPAVLVTDALGAGGRS